MKETRTHRMVISGMMIALATVLSFVKLFEAPMGGSVTLLSMLPLCLISIRYGVKWGVFSSEIHALLQIMIGGSALAKSGISFQALIGSFVFDYLLAFGVLALAGMFCVRANHDDELYDEKKQGNHGQRAFIGVIVAVALRFICHTISGCIFFSEWCWEGWNLMLYSVCYNGAYMLPEMIFTACGAWALLRIPVSRKLFAPV